MEDLRPGLNVDLHDGTVRWVREDGTFDLLPVEATELSFAVPVGAPSDTVTVTLRALVPLSNVRKR